MDPFCFFIFQKQNIFLKKLGILSSYIGLYIGSKLIIFSIDIHNILDDFDTTLSLQSKMLLLPEKISNNVVLEIPLILLSL